LDNGLLCLVCLHLLLLCRHVLSITPTGLLSKPVVRLQHQQSGSKSAHSCDSLTLSCHSAA
jgi:hypothetical protein